MRHPPPDPHPVLTRAALLALDAEGLSIKEQVARTGYSRSFLQRWRTFYGITTSGGRALTKARRSEIVLLLRAGQRVSTVARMTGLTEERVRQIRVEEGLPVRPRTALSRRSSLAPGEIAAGGGDGVAMVGVN